MTVGTAKTVSAAEAAQGAPDGPPAARLRVLEVCTMFGVGGISRHVLQLGDWLSARGHDVAYAGAPGPWLNEGTGRRFVAADIHTVSGDRKGAALLGRLSALAASALKLRAWLRRHPVDVIHAHESAPALVARLAAIGAGVPVVLTYHGADPGRVRQFGAVARACAAKVICVSHRSADDLAADGGVPRDRIEVIGLGVAEAPAPDPARVTALRSRLLGQDGSVLVVTVARLTHQKGIDILVQAVARLAGHMPHVRFVVVGDGPLEKQAQLWAAEARVADKIAFVGRSEEPDLYLAAADIFLLTSRWEALPFTIAEAFRAGLPAIATDCGGVAELIDDTVGRVVPVGDPVRVAEAVATLAADRGLRETLAAGALARSREDRFRPEFNQARIEQLYQSLAARRATSAPSSEISR